jgi:hypothetical protein
MSGMNTMQAHLQVKGLTEMREAMHNVTRVLETVAEARAYDTVPGTKASTRNTRSSKRQYNKRLAPTIQRFKNKDNPFKAYVVVGNLTWPRGGAIYAPMQLGGYRPGRHRKAAKAAVIAKFGSTAKGNATNVGRSALALQKRRIPGKDYFQKAYAMVGQQVQDLAMRKSVAILDKSLAKI